MKKKVIIRSLGCKLNQFEAHALLGQFLSAGWEASSSDADVCVINTCTVTEKADRKSRNLLRRLIRENPRAKIAVTGCYATTDPDDIKSSGPVDLIIPNNRKSEIFALLHKEFFQEQVVQTGNFPVLESFYGRERPFIKIQEGCDGSCAYCKVRFARGPSSSVPLKIILQQVRTLSENGFKEIVLTGVNILSFRDGKKGLPSLLKEIFRLDLPLRVRLASLEPQDMGDDFLEMLRDRRLCDHFHFALQTGSAEISKKMGRNFLPEQFESLIGEIRKVRPESGIGADIITGFPGETERNFKETTGLLEELEIPFMHIFRYSDRAGTVAAGMPDKVSEKEKISRSHELHALNAKLEWDFKRQFKGKELEVLVEGGSCLASNYIEIHPLRQNPEFRGALKHMMVTHVENGKTAGKFV